MGKGFVQQNLMHPSSSLMQNKEGLHNRNLLLNKTGILTISSVSCGSLPAATNMLAISFARHNKQQVNSVLSDGLAIALAVGIILGAVLYCVAPAALAKISGPKGVDLIAPACSYVRIRWSLAHVWAVAFHFGCRGCSGLTISMSAHVMANREQLQKAVFSSFCISYAQLCSMSA